MRRYGLHLIRYLVGCACLLPALLMAEPQCDDSNAKALDLLERMSRAGMTVGHRGMATLQRDGDMRVLEIHRDIQDETVTDTLTLLTGQSARVVRAGHPDSCTHPGHTLLRLRQDSADVCGVAAHYRLSLERGDRVAGRTTQRIVAQPRDMYRYAHVLEVDEETAQLLKVTTFTADGRPLEQFQYASLALNDSASAESGTGDQHTKATAGVDIPSDRESSPQPETGSDTGSETGNAASGEATGAMRWRPGWLPAGFVATQSDVAGSRQTYTDGMASFSVFLEQVTTTMQPGEGAVREGSTLAYTRGMRLAGATVLVTVVGEVPVNTARIVADSVRVR